MLRSRLNPKFLARLIVAGLIVGTFPGALTAQTPDSQEGSSINRPDPFANLEESRPVFEFHSGFWINMHHFLYLQARIRNQQSTSRGNVANPLQAGSAQSAPGVAADTTSPEWNAAVDYYAKHFASRDLLFDDIMVLVNDRFAELENCPDLSGRTSPACASGFRPEMIQVLEAAAPFYRAHWWQAQDQRNREWVESEDELIRNMGGSLAGQLASVYRTPWPSAPIRVDVVSYGGPFGAYTTLDPVHITLSSADSRNQGLAGFEILFHEASHALAGSVEDGIARECRQREIPIPRDLWHALLFYTTGQLVKRAFVRSAARPGTGPAAVSTSLKTYLPYAYQNGLYDRGWQNYQRVLEAYWQPYLDGKTDFDHALTAVVAHL
jgi:hypothetical protein